MLFRPLTKSERKQANAVRYIKINAWDAFLCTFASASLNFAVMRSVFIPEALMDTILPVLLFCAVWQILLFAAAYNKKTIVSALILFVLATVIIGVLVYSGTFRPDAFAFYVLLTFLASAIVFLLSRTNAGAVVLACIGVLTIGSMTFLRYGDFIISMTVYLFSSVCLFFFRRHRALLTAGSGKIRLRYFTAATGCICAAAVALSACMYFAVIQPANPPTRGLKLITRLKTLPILEKLGVSAFIYLFDPDQTATPRNDESIISDEDAPTGDDNSTQSPSSDDNSDTDTETLMQGAINRKPASPVSYFGADNSWLILPIPVLLIIITVFVLKQLHRKLRLKRFAVNGKKEQIALIYGYLIEKLPLAGIPSAGYDTAYEYSERIETRVERIFPEGIFSGLTRVFCQTLYGKYEPCEDEFTMFIRCYKDFPSGCRHSIGFWRYILKYFRF